MKLYLLFAICAHVQGNSLANEIHGSKNATIREYPYQVSLLTYGQHTCGGAIISDEWIITSANCIFNDWEFCSIRAGSSHHDRDGTIHTISKVIVHKNYHLNEHHRPVNDIALVRVNEKFNFTDVSYQSIELFDARANIAIGTNATTTGWGYIKYSPLADILQVVEISVISNDQCHKALISYGGRVAGQICAINPQGGKSSCNGDYGNPVVINGRLAAVTSGWLIDCGDAYPGIYTKLPPYRSWIEDEIGI